MEEDDLLSRKFKKACQMLAQIPIFFTPFFLIPNKIETKTQKQKLGGSVLRRLASSSDSMLSDKSLQCPSLKHRTLNPFRVL